MRRAGCWPACDTNEVSTTRADRTKLGHCDLLLTGGVVVTVDDDFTVFDAGAVAIVDDRIVGVGHKSEFASVDATRTVDCSGKLCTFLNGYSMTPCGSARAAR